MHPVQALPRMLLPVLALKVATVARMQARRATAVRRVDDGKEVVRPAYLFRV